MIVKGKYYRLHYEELGEHIPWRCVDIENDFAILTRMGESYAGTPRLYSMTVEVDTDSLVECNPIITVHISKDNSFVDVNIPSEGEIRITRDGYIHVTGVSDNSKSGRLWTIRGLAGMA